MDEQERREIWDALWESSSETYAALGETTDNLNLLALVVKRLKETAEDSKATVAVMEERIHQLQDRIDHLEHRLNDKFDQIDDALRSIANEL
ncbi:MAG: hypothetical protein ACPF92_06105 [Candidatus Poseidoniaceae archaeon]